MIEKELSLPQAKTENVVIQELPEELLVYDLKQNQAHCLNKMAAMIWQLCDGQTSVTEIAILVREAGNVAMDEATIWLAIEQLRQAHLLKEPTSFPSESVRLTRRNAVKKIGLGAALALPWITSVVAPTAVMAASKPICENTCRSNPSLVGSAAKCGDCAALPGRCWNNFNCSGSPFSTTCQACGFLSWEPI